MIFHRWHTPAGFRIHEEYKRFKTQKCLDVETGVKHSCFCIQELQKTVYGSQRCELILDEVHSRKVTVSPYRASRDEQHTIAILLSSPEELCRWRRNVKKLWRDLAFDSRFLPRTWLFISPTNL